MLKVQFPDKTDTQINQNFKRRQFPEKTEFEKETVSGQVSLK